MKPQHFLSFSRVLLGLYIFTELAHSNQSYVVLPAALAACAADYLDGIFARVSNSETVIGRLIDNACDGSFLAMAFCGFAEATTWSHPLVGSATRFWEHANWLPVVGLAASFGLYLGRWAITLRHGEAPAPSPRGHHAGVLNYALAVAGGVAVIPGANVTPWLLEPLFVTVFLLNLSAAYENLMLLPVELRKER